MNDNYEEYAIEAFKATMNHPAMLIPKVLSSKHIIGDGITIKHVGPEVGPTKKEVIDAFVLYNKEGINKMRRERENAVGEG